MQSTLIILAHPNINSGSLANIEIVKKLQNMEEVEIRNIKELYPDFIIDVDAEQEALTKADNIIFQFPLYWYGVPGILKEWMDQVLGYGFAFGGTDGNKLYGKEFLLSTTVGGQKKSYQQGEYNNFDLETLLRPLEQAVHLMGMNYNQPIASYGMIYIEGVYNQKDPIVSKAQEHGEQVAQWIKSKQ